MFPKPVVYATVSWHNCDLAQLSPKAYGAKVLAQYQHIGVKPQRSVEVTKPAPGDAIHEVTKLCHAFGLFGFF